MSAAAWKHWRALLRPGDVLLLGLAAWLCVQLSLSLWRGGQAQTVEVRVAGKLVAELALAEDARFEAAGALGISLIEVLDGQVRVASDPGPRQYCVRQGWLSQAGAVAICAPNQVSLHLRARGGDLGYDSLAY